MDSYKSTVIENSLKIRSRRMKYLKMARTTLFWMIAIIPWFFCFKLYSKVDKLKVENSELKNQNIELSLKIDDEKIIKDNNLYANEGAIKDNEEDNTSYINGVENSGSGKENSSNTDISQSIQANSDSIQTSADASTDLNNSNQTNANIQIDNSTSSSISNRMSDKSVYLTFDDGPSKYTGNILDILNKYNVKATFFVIGKTDEGSLAMYKRIVNEGHTLGMHSYSHDYNIIYNSLEDFDKDFTKLRDLLYDTTGYLPNIYRFPGGSANFVSSNKMNDFIHYLDSKSVIYYDWNVVNGDATGEKFDKEQLVTNVINGVEKYSQSIVLMHDTSTKEATIDSLEELIITLTNQGASLLALNEEVKPIQQIKIKTSE